MHAPNHTNAQTTNPSKPVRFVIRFKGQPFFINEHPIEKIQVDSINKELTCITIAPKLRTIGAHWNMAGNCILSFLTNAPFTLIKDHLSIIKKALDLAAETEISQDIPWLKVVLSGVLTHQLYSDPVFLPESLLEALLQNLTISDLRITQPSRWVRPLNNIDGFHSSFSFAFEDKDGSAIKTLLNMPLFMFGDQAKFKC